MLTIRARLWLKGVRRSFIDLLSWWIVQISLRVYMRAMRFRILRDIPARVKEKDEIFEDRYDRPLEAR